MHTGPIPAIVTAEITMNLVVGEEFGVPVPAHFSYSAHDPLSVMARFEAAGNTVEWVFARDLLLEGTKRPVGEGDVTCWPATVTGEQVVCIALRSPSGQALLEAPAGDIKEFLDRSYTSVPVSHEVEHLDIDGLIRDLLDAGEQ